MRKLPPLAALRAFEAVARHQSFKRAAAELLVTPTAISHQVRHLEDQLGQKMFHRKPRQVEMTAAAQSLYPVLRDAFDDMANAVVAIQQSAGSRQVTLTTTMAVAARWLIPRMSEFGRDYPDVNLKLIACEEVVDLVSGEADIAIRYGTTPVYGCTSTELSPTRFAPICTPGLGLTSPEQLSEVPLIHYEWEILCEDTPTWPVWLKAAGITRGRFQGDRTFSDETHAIEAAIAGQGVALLALPLVKDDLLSGTIVSPFGPQLAGQPLTLLASNRRLEDPEVREVHDWLIAAGRTGPAALAD